MVDEHVGNVSRFPLSACLALLPLREQTSRADNLIVLLHVAYRLATLSIITALSATFAKNGNASVGNAVVAFLFFFFGFYDLGKLYIHRCVSLSQSCSSGVVSVPLLISFSCLSVRSPLFLLLQLTLA